MEIAEDEIAEGLVAYLDQRALTDSPAVLDTYPQQSVEVRPFVCIKAENGQSHWTPLSTAWRRERLKIEAAWRTGGEDSWPGFVCYLNDGANVYIGPNTEFVAASSHERTDRATRSRLSPPGVAAVKAEVDRQRRRRLAGHDA